MADISGRLRELDALERLAGGRTAVHRLHPGAKLLAALVYLVTVVSFSRFALGRLIPFFFYPFVLAAAAEAPWPPILRRIAPVLPFAALAGLSNLLFDTAPAAYLGGVAVSRGALSCLVILARTFLTVSAVLLLAATTPFTDLTDELRRVRLPEALVLLFGMLYRYVGALLDQALAMYTAYRLRHPRGRGVELRDMGPFAGQLLLRSFDRAERVYAAMRCRGYGRPAAAREGRRWTGRDYLFVLLVAAPCAALRIWNVGALWARLAGRFF